MSSYKPIKISLEKFYLDCIDNSGNCFIIYLAKLNFFFMKFYYSGLIYSDTADLTKEICSFRKTWMPVSGDILSVHQSILNIKVNWENIDNPISRLIYKYDDHNELIWNCHHPKTMCKVDFNGTAFNGFGYAETLYLPKKTWSLPVDELRWGRYLTEGNTVIWICLKGKHAMNTIFLNGVEYNDAVHSENSVAFCHGIYQLEFPEMHILRNGNLSNLFSKMPVLKIFFSSKLLNTKEIKYKVKTILSKNSIEVDTGWSILEIVTWEK